MIIIIQSYVGQGSSMASMTLTVVTTLESSFTTMLTDFISMSIKLTKPPYKSWKYTYELNQLPTHWLGYNCH